MAMSIDQQKAVLAALMMGSVLNEYDHTESDKVMNIIKKRLKKFLRIMAKRNFKHYKEIAKASNDIWIDAIENFNHQKLSALSFVCAVYIAFEDELNSKAGVTSKLFDSMMSKDDNNFFELEKNSQNVAAYLIDQISKLGYEFKQNNSARLKSLISQKHNELILEDRLK